MRRFVFHQPYPVAGEEDLREVPAELVRDPRKPQRARPSAIAALKSMAESAGAAGVRVISISSYRGFAAQRDLHRDAERRHGSGRGKLWVAPPGYSEHHTGYVFDLADRDRPETDDEPVFESTPAFSWLQKNAANFGFELSFPKSNWQGVSYEPWHWKFTGDAQAKRTFYPPFPACCLRLARSVFKAAV